MQIGKGARGYAERPSRAKQGSTDQRCLFASAGSRIEGFLTLYGEAAADARTATGSFLMRRPYDGGRRRLLLRLTLQQRRRL
jgi:hypothetical protein